MAESELQMWPISALVTRLKGDHLAQLIAPRQNRPGHDVRENLLESLVEEVMVDAFERENVFLRKPVRAILGLQDAPFPASALPDIAVRRDGQIRFCELKSNRVDYARFDNVFESKPFRAYLGSIGDGGAVPWEVEQDLIKLHLYKSLAPTVGSCLFLMIDAYAGSGLSWSQVFQSRARFLETMQTKLIRSLADQLLAATTITPLHGRLPGLVNAHAASWSADAIA